MARVYISRNASSENHYGLWMDSNEPPKDFLILCEDKTIEFHRLVLAEFSNFFKGYPEDVSYFLAQDMEYRDLMAIRQFLYIGMASLRSDQLPRLLMIAQNLEISCLEDVIRTELNKQNGRIQSGSTGVLTSGPTRPPVAESSEAIGANNRSAVANNNDTGSLLSTQPQIPPTSNPSPTSGTQSTTQDSSRRKRKKDSSDEDSESNKDQEWKPTPRKKCPKKKQTAPRRSNKQIKINDGGNLTPTPDRPVNPPHNTVQTITPETTNTPMVVPNEEPGPSSGSPESQLPTPASVQNDASNRASIVNSDTLVTAGTSSARNPHSSNVNLMRTLLQAWYEGLEDAVNGAVTIDQLKRAMQDRGHQLSHGQVERLKRDLIEMRRQYRAGNRNSGFDNFFPLPEKMELLLDENIDGLASTSRQTYSIGINGTSCNEDDEDLFDVLTWSLEETESFLEVWTNLCEKMSATATEMYSELLDTFKKMGFKKDALDVYKVWKKLIEFYQNNKFGTRRHVFHFYALLQRFELVDDRLISLPESAFTGLECPEDSNEDQSNTNVVTGAHENISVNNEQIAMDTETAVEGGGIQSQTSAFQTSRQPTLTPSNHKEAKDKGADVNGMKQKDLGGKQRKKKQLLLQFREFLEAYVVVANQNEGKVHVRQVQDQINSQREAAYKVCYKHVYPKMRKLTDMFENMDSLKPYWDIVEKLAFSTANVNDPADESTAEIMDESSPDSSSDDEKSVNGDAQEQNVKALNDAPANAPTTTSEIDSDDESSESDDDVGTLSVGTKSDNEDDLNISAFDMLDQKASQQWSEREREALLKVWAEDEPSESGDSKLPVAAVRNEFERLNIRRDHNEIKSKMNEIRKFYQDFLRLGDGNLGALEPFKNLLEKIKFNKYH